MTQENTPALYHIVKKEKLREILSAFEACVDLPLQVLDEYGNVLSHFGRTAEYCTTFQASVPDPRCCSRLHTASAKQAVALGDIYIFACHAGLNHMVFPLMNQSQFLGSILAGPFLMEKPDSMLISEIGRSHALTSTTMLNLYEDASYIPVIEPSKVTQISRLLFYLFSNLIPGSKELFSDNKSKLYQQSQINESIQRYKTGESAAPSSYPYDKEKDLLTKVKTGNSQEANSVLNDLLGYVFFSEGNNLEFVKSRAIELCSLLSRTAIESGAATDAILKINNQFLKSIHDINTMDTLCFKLQEVVDVFTDSIFRTIPAKNSEAIRKAIHFISQNFSSPITLQDVAEYVHLNATYFSTLFKQAMGSSFKDYLNMVRIEESKRLLANTDYSIINIAIATGFEDQSYFSKVFKKYTGLTPKQYR